MKRKLKYFLPALTVFFATTGFAQTTELLDINNISARINANGLIFNDQTNSFAGFEVPTGSGSHTFYSAQLTVGGLDVNGQLHTATPESGYDVTWTIGPVIDHPDSMPSSFQRLWKVERTDIDYHIGVTTGAINDPSYQIPASIADWPAHGVVSLGMAPDLAPFVDVNLDGNYVPADGDYPDVCGDQTIYVIYNDYLRNSAWKMKVEVHGMFCVYDCPQDEALSNTVFASYRIINRSTQTYFETWLGYWTDMDVGGSTDDYIETDVERSSVFTFNGDNYDEGGNGVVGYENHPAAQSVTFLAGPFQDADGLDNAVGIQQNESLTGIGFGDGIIDNERSGMMRSMTYSSALPQGGSPATYLEFYEFTRGNWPGGVPMVYGGTGHPADPNADPNTPAWFVLPNDSDPQGWGTGGVAQSPWSEAGLGNPVSDRRGVASVGNFTLDPGGEALLDLAFVFGQDLNDTTAQGGVQAMKANIDDILDYYSNTSPCGSLNVGLETPQKELEAKVYPNPLLDFLNVELEAEGQSAYQLYNLLGELVKEGQLNQGKNSISTSNLTPGIYFIQIQQNETRKTVKLLKQ